MGELRSKEDLAVELQVAYKRLRSINSQSSPQFPTNVHQPADEDAETVSMSWPRPVTAPGPAATDLRHLVTSTAPSLEEWYRESRRDSTSETQTIPMRGKAVAREAYKEAVETRDVERLPPALREVEASICSCGNVFMPDAVYCRQCGKPR